MEEVSNRYPLRTTTESQSYFTLGITLMSRQLKSTGSKRTPFGLT